MANSTVDLHLHTTASDGTDSPAELVQRAIAAGLKVIAVTDHDSTEGVAEALSAAQGSGLEVVPGIELSTDVAESEVHVVGYFVDTADEELQRVLRLLRESRRGRARAMVDKLAVLGIDIAWDRVKAFAGNGAVGRPHVAQALVEKGYVPTAADAFALYIGRNGPAYVDRYKLTPAEAVRLISRARGLAGLAHPVLGIVAGQMQELEMVDAMLPELKTAGMAAIECFYTGYSQAMTDLLLERARRFDFVPTGGSDYHGRNLEGSVLGDVYVPETSVVELARRRDSRR
ncbi:MAG: PHP domain-containing protein [Chloroflexota bacterium]